METALITSYLRLFLPADLTLPPFQYCNVGFQQTQYKYCSSSHILVSKLLYNVHKIRLASGRQHFAMSLYQGSTLNPVSV
jgi:hypothetical protein